MSGLKAVKQSHKALLIYYHISNIFFRGGSKLMLVFFFPVVRTKGCWAEFVCGLVNFLGKSKRLTSMCYYHKQWGMKGVMLKAFMKEHWNLKPTLKPVNWFYGTDNEMGEISWWRVAPMPPEMCRELLRVACSRKSPDWAAGNKNGSFLPGPDFSMVGTVDMT